jgi:osmoprotectant transport system ATP-binding protein
MVLNPIAHCLLPNTVYPFVIRNSSFIISSIVFTHLSCTIGATPILRGITTTIAAGKVTALIGRSGSGKSTLLRTVNGMVRPTAGTVHVFDAPLDYRALPAVRRRIGYSVQGTGLFPHLTVERNVLLPARISDIDPVSLHDRVAHLFALVNLPVSFLQKYPHELSGGEQQRVGICRALLLDPPIVLLDEPFGALDPTTRSEIHQEVLRIQHTAPRTMLLVTHDLREARRLADEVLVLDAGTVLQQGDRDDVFDNPASEQIAAYFRSAE